MNQSEITTKFVVVNIRSQEFGINIAYVRSIEKMQPVIDLPVCEKHVEGIIQLRAEVLPVLNLSKMLGTINITPLNDSSRLISLSVNNQCICFAVDSANEVLDIAREDIQGMPNISKETDFIEGIAKLDKRLIVLLNLEKLLSDDFCLPTNINHTLLEIM